VGEICQIGWWEVDSHEGGTLMPRYEEATKHFGAMANEGLHMPVLGLLAVSEGDAPLVACGCVCGKDIVAEAGSCVDFIWDACFCEYGQVNVLGLQRPADWDEAAVPAVLDIVGGQFEARGVLLRFVLVLEGQPMQRCEVILMVELGVQWP
jgi:hypothetical protein